MVIVSQWTSMLEIVKTHIEKIGLKVTEIHGKVPIKSRGDIVDNFNKEGKGAQVIICVHIVILVIILVILVMFVFDVVLLPALPQVMLLSLGAGGVGLNLVGANHLFLLDCHWNPQVGWLFSANCLFVNFVNFVSFSWRSRPATGSIELARRGKSSSTGNVECGSLSFVKIWLCRFESSFDDGIVGIYLINYLRFIMKNTVEENIMALQEKKLQLADGVLTGAKRTGANKLTLKELTSLFS